jgi:hypothetical protein
LSRSKMKSLRNKKSKISFGPKQRQRSARDSKILKPNKIDSESNKRNLRSRSTERM